MTTLLLTYFIGIFIVLPMLIVGHSVKHEKRKRLITRRISRSRMRD